MENNKSVVPYLIDHQSHCCDFDPLLLGTTVHKELFHDHSTTSYQSLFYMKWKVFIVSSVPKKSLLIRKHFYVMAVISNYLFRGGCHSYRPHVPACNKVYFNLNESVKLMVVDGTCHF